MITINIGNYIADSQKPHVVRFSKKYVAKTTGRITWQIRYKSKYRYEPEEILRNAVEREGWGRLNDIAYKAHIGASTGKFTFKSEPHQNGDETDIVDKYLLGGTGDGARSKLLKDKYNLHFRLL